MNDRIDDREITICGASFYQSDIVRLLERCANSAGELGHLTVHNATTKVRARFVARRES